MREQIRLMKENAVTQEDRENIKEIKKQMKDEWKGMWKDLRDSKETHKKEHKCAKRKDKHHGKKYCAKHVADVTVPDNSELPADSPVTKTWRLRNAGEQRWPEDSQLIFISRKGDNLNGPERVHVGGVDPGMEVEVSVTFITPADAGRYVGYYRMATGAGDKFGQRLWVSFVIPPTVPLAHHHHQQAGLYPSVNNNVNNNNYNNGVPSPATAAHGGAQTTLVPYAPVAGSIDVTMD